LTFVYIFLYILIFVVWLRFVNHLLNYYLLTYLLILKLTGLPEEDMDDYHYKHCSAWWPWAVTLWPWNWCRMSPVARITIFANFGASATFLCRVIDKHASNDDVTLWPWTLTFELIGDVSLLCHSILDLGSGTVQTDERTDRRRPLTVYAPTLRVRWHNN